MGTRIRTEVVAAGHRRAVDRIAGGTRTLDSRVGAGAERVGVGVGDRTGTGAKLSEEEEEEGGEQDRLGIVPGHKVAALDPSAGHPPGAHVQNVK